MAKKPLPDANLLRQLLDYDPETGVLTWRPRTPDMFRDGFRTAEGNCNLWNSRYAGSPAFTHLTNRGYLTGRIANRLYLAHRIIWKISYGDNPDTVDHIDGDTLNNRIANLRSVSFVVNARNRRMRSDNPHGHQGIYNVGHPHRPWKANIGQRTLGCFATFDEAVSAREKAEAEMGYHRR